MTELDLWNDESTVASKGIDVPRWIEQDITVNAIAAILHGGCESGAYMPAVTYWDAMNTMGEHGDDVIQYIDDEMGELPDMPKEKSWSGMAVFYLSCAVELWASSVQSELEER